MFCFVHYYLCLVFSVFLFWPSTSVEKYSFSYMCQSELVCLHSLINQGSFENLCWLSALLCLKTLSLQFVTEALLSNSHLLRKEEVLTPCYFEWAYQWFGCVCPWSGQWDNFQYYSIAFCHVSLWKVNGGGSYSFLNCTFVFFLKKSYWWKVFHICYIDILTNICSTYILKHVTKQVILRLHIM